MLIDDFLATVAPDLPGCPTPSLRLAVIAAAKEFFTESMVWDEIQDEVQIIANVQDYSLDAPEAGVKCIGLKAIYAPWMVRGQLIGSTMADIARELPTWNTATGGLPSHYTRAFDFDNFRVFPIPSNVPASGSTVRPHAIYTITDAATKLPDDMVLRYGEAIASGAKYRLMLQPKKTWSADAALAAYHKQQFEDGKIRAKVDAMHSKTTGDHYVPPRIFGR